MSTTTLIVLIVVLLVLGGGGITGVATPGAVGGEQSHVQDLTELVPHTHPAGNGTGGAGSGGGSGFNFANPPGVSGSTGGGVAMNVTQPTLVTNYMIRL